MQFCLSRTSQAPSPQLTVCLAFGRKTYTTSRSKSAGSTSSGSVYHWLGTMVDARCVRDKYIYIYNNIYYISLGHVDVLFVRIGDIGLVHSLVGITVILQEYEQTREHHHIFVSDAKAEFRPSDESILRLLPGAQPSCCTTVITANGGMCSTTMAAPCIIDDDGASCEALAKPALTLCSVNGEYFLADIHACYFGLSWFTALRCMRRRTC